MTWGGLGEQRGEVVPDEVRMPSNRFVGTGLVLEDAGRDHHSVPGIEPVVGHEAGDLAHERHEPLVHEASGLGRIGTPSYRRTAAYITKLLTAFWVSSSAGTSYPCRRWRGSLRASGNHLKGRLG